MLVSISALRCLGVLRAHGSEVMGLDLGFES